MRIKWYVPVKFVSVMLSDETIKIVSLEAGMAKTVGLFLYICVYERKACFSGYPSRG